MSSSIRARDSLLLRAIWTCSSLSPWLHTGPSTRSSYWVGLLRGLISLSGNPHWRYPFLCSLQWDDYEETHDVPSHRKPIVFSPFVLTVKLFAKFSLKTRHLNTACHTRILIYIDKIRKNTFSANFTTSPLISCWTAIQLLCLSSTKGTASHVLYISVPSILWVLLLLWLDYMFVRI